VAGERGLPLVRRGVEMPVTKDLKPVQPQPGKPLYLAAKDRIREAIDAGAFTPGEQMPSTKDLSEQLEISLVTAHRALQELVNAGVLQRSQGKGTFVHQAYLEGRRTISESRVGLMIQSGASLADVYHGQVVEGIRQAAHSMHVDLLLLRFDEDIRKECNGFLYVNPLPAELEALASGSKRRAPVVVIGARSDFPNVSSIDVDHAQLARQAVAHLAGHGHTQIGYVGGPDDVMHNRNRWHGFLEGLGERNLSPRPQWMLKGSSWRLDDRERNELIRLLSGPNRPTAIFAAGFCFALDVYAAAQTVGLRIGETLSVVGVDDPPSAAFLSPPLTTMRQPLIQLGHGAITALVERIRNDNAPVENRVLQAELVIRRSSGPVGRA
jgi:DNA-binding LacI/PurR family transcriptional regulator